MRAVRLAWANMPHARTMFFVSAFAVFMIFTPNKPLDPGATWNDHVFYWGQANHWLSLEQPLTLDLDTSALLYKFQHTYYYDAANGVSEQPPYVYRPLVPLLAGVLGKFMPLGWAFLAITAASLLVTGFSCGWAVYRLSGRISAASLAIITVLWVPGVGYFTQFFALVDPASLAVVSVCLALLSSNRIKWALLLAVIVGPLVKETLLPLGLVVVLWAFITGTKVRWWWCVALMPFFIQAALRLVIHVPSPPALGEMFVIGHPVLAIHTFLDAFAVVLVLVFGMLNQKVRPLVVATLPLVGWLIVINSSTVAAGSRIWLTYLPVLVVCGVAGGAISLDRSWWASTSWQILIVVSIGIGEAVSIALLPRYTITALVLLQLAWILVVYSRLDSPRVTERSR